MKPDTWFICGHIWIVGGLVILRLQHPLGAAMAAMTGTVFLLLYLLTALQETKEDKKP